MTVKKVNFRKSNCHIPTLSSYKGKFPQSYWDNFTKRDLRTKPESWISTEKLQEVARRVNHKNKKELEVAENILTHGADLACVGSARLGTKMRNAPSCFEYGERVMDSMEDWLQQDLAAGPLTKEELLCHFKWEEVTINPISVRLKPNGKARIIVDMSSPHLKEVDLTSQIPSSVNSGISKKTWPATMASTKDVIKLLYAKGVGAVFCKCDWTAAYKHIHVRAGDLHLQVLEIGGRYFVERALVFGCVSSPGIYDFIAKLIIKLATLEAGVEPASVLQCLDDVVAVAGAEETSCSEFYHTYRKVCAEVGVKLAPEGDKDKAFPPDTVGTILGIEYDTVKFQWRIPRVKASYITQTLYKIIDGDTVTNGEIMKLSGRLDHYYPLVPGGKFERFWISRLSDSLKPKHMPVQPDRLAMSQARWWVWNVTASLEWNTIPDVRDLRPAHYIPLFPDAAGGSDQNIALGFGGCIWTERGTIPWCYLPWPELIREDRKNRWGMKFARKLSVLEAVAALGLLSSEPVLLKGRNVRIFSDNIGFVLSYRKGNSTCSYLVTVIKALNAVAMGLNIGLTVSWSPRVSGTGEEIADHLSKGRIEEALALSERFREEPSEIPRTLVSWLQHPTPSRLLGQGIVEEISQHTQVLRWNLEAESDVLPLVRRGKRKPNWVL